MPEHEPHSPNTSAYFTPGNRARLVGPVTFGAGAGLLVVLSAEAIVGDGPIERAGKRAELDNQIDDFDLETDMIGSVNSKGGVFMGQEAIQHLEAQKPKEFFPNDAVIEVGTAVSLGIFATFALAGLYNRIRNRTNH